MAEPAHEDEYDDAPVAMLGLIWGEGFLSPGGPEAVRDMVKGIDPAAINDWWRIEARDEYERMKGPLNPRMRELPGDEKTAHFVESRRRLVAVLDNGELRPGCLRARKPA